MHRWHQCRWSFGELSTKDVYVVIDDLPKHFSCIARQTVLVHIV